MTQLLHTTTINRIYIGLNKGSGGYIGEMFGCDEQS